MTRPTDPKPCTCPRARHRHGTRAAYTTCGCRCLPCRLVYDEAVRNRRRGQRATREVGWVDRAGTRRRIQALHAIGWSGGQLAERLGVRYQRIHELRASQRPIFPGTAARVTALYDELWDKTPTGPHVTKTIGWARRNGWVPPMGLDDDRIDDPNYTPAPVTTRGGWDRLPCGTEAAAKRHRRRGEPLDRACLRDETRRGRERTHDRKKAA